MTKSTMTLVCECHVDGFYDFTHTDHRGVVREFTLTADEITKLKTQEYPVFDNRYQFGIIEPVIGKMVMAMELLWGLQYMPGNSLQITEQ